MNNGAYYLAALLTPLIVTLVLWFYSLRTRSKIASCGVIKYPNFILFFAVIDLIICIAIPILDKYSIHYDSHSRAAIIFVSIGLGLFSILSIAVILSVVNIRLIIDDDKLIHKNVFGIKKEYQYSKITGIYVHYVRNMKTPEKYSIYIEKKKITINYLMSNFWTFEELIKKRLRKANNKIKIEVASKKHK